jgi:hypothetical protein
MRTLKAVLLGAVILIGTMVPCLAQGPGDEGDEPGDEAVFGPQAGGSPITQDGATTELSGTGGGRQDPQARTGTEERRRSPNPVKLGGGGGGGRGGGGGGGSSGGSGGKGDSQFAGKFRIIDINHVPPLGGHGELAMPPGAAWAIRFKARPGAFFFNVLTRTGGDPDTNVKAAVSAKAGTLSAGAGCTDERVVSLGGPMVFVYIGDNPPKWGCKLKAGGIYYFNVYSDGGCVRPGAVTRGCPTIFDVTNGGIQYLAPDKQN